MEGFARCKIQNRPTAKASGGDSAHRTRSSLKENCFVKTVCKHFVWSTLRKNISGTIKDCLRVFEYFWNLRVTSRSRAAIFYTPSDVRGTARTIWFSQFLQPSYFFFFFRKNLSAAERVPFSREANFAAVCIRHYEARGNPARVPFWANGKDILSLSLSSARARAKREVILINNAPSCEVANKNCERTKFLSG